MNEPQIDKADIARALDRYLRSPAGPTVEAIREVFREAIRDAVPQAAPRAIHSEEAAGQPSGR